MGRSPRIILLLTTLILFSVGMPAAKAGDATWTANGPEAGRIMQLAVDPHSVDRHQ